MSTLRQVDVHDETGNGPVLRLIAIVLLLNAFLLALALPRAGGVGSDWLALEALIAGGLFCLLAKRRWARLWAWLVGALVALLALLAFFDGVARLAVNRPLNLYLDWPHVVSIYHLITGNLSLPAALAGTVVLVVLVIGIAWTITALLQHLSVAGSGAGAARGVAATMLILSVAVVILGPAAREPLRASTPAITLVTDQIQQGRRTHAELAAFDEQLATGKDPVTPLAGLGDTDVILGLLESYGASAVFDERYAREILPRLAAMEAGITANDLHMVSGTINAPIFGGQSWLAHGTLLSGLWIDSHPRYERLLDSDRNNLVREFNATGHETMTLMPANVQPWPEGTWFGYDRYFDARALNYAGPSLNWVTMPDQYVWSHFQDQIRSSIDAPIFAKIVLVSSHAPWVPVLPVIDDWDTIGDGRLFEQWADEADSPQEVWSDPERIRDHFARSVGYAVDVAAAYAERYVDDDTLLILMGDHQPAPIITGADASPAVPVHIISGNPQLLEPFRRHGFVDGAMPATEHPDHAMDEFRGWLSAAFGDVER